jgi:hypothetical protein
VYQLLNDLFYVTTSQAARTDIGAFYSCPGFNPGALEVRHYLPFCFVVGMAYIVADRLFLAA